MDTAINDYWSWNFYYYKSDKAGPSIAQLRRETHNQFLMVHLTKIMEASYHFNEESCWAKHNKLEPEKKVSATI